LSFYFVDNNVLNEVAKHHKEWVGIVKMFGEKCFAEDIVQEMYLRLHKYGEEDKIIINNKVNKGFIWVILKNSFSTYQSKKQKAIKVDLIETKDLISDYIEIDNYICKDKALDILSERVKKEIEKFNFYDKNIWNIYMNGNKSMRSLSSETGITTDSIFNTIKKCKKKITIVINEDYEDFTNKDFDKIK
jgi:hypothetical protein